MVTRERVEGRGALFESPDRMSGPLRKDPHKVAHALAFGVVTVARDDGLDWDVASE